MEDTKMASPKIIVAGMADTKFTELKFVAQEVKKAGGDVRIMNCGCGVPCDWADISLQDILDVVGVKQEDIFKSPRSTAVKTVGEAGAIKIMQMYEAGEVDGIISWAGSMGTTTVTYLMRALPFGVPKIMLTDMASSDVSQWLGNKDIYIVNPTAEQGINIVTRKQVANAAAAIVAMAKVGEVVIPEEEKRPLMAITAYGTTTHTVNRCSEYFGKKGWDTIIIHQVGTGATMEDLIRSGQITALLDLTTGEITNKIYDSPYRVPDTWNSERCTAAADVGIPQVITPGGCDQSACGPLASVRADLIEDFKTGKRRPYRDTGIPYLHNEGVTIMFPTDEEIEYISHYFAEKLNNTKGPTAFVLPMQGWSAYDQPERKCSLERGWAAGNGDAPQWQPADENQDYAKRSVIMRDILKKEFNQENENLDLILVDLNIVEPEFAELSCRIMDDMLAGTWKKGMYRDLPYVIE